MEKLCLRGRSSSAFLPFPSPSFLPSLHLSLSPLHRDPVPALLCSLSTRIPVLTLTTRSLINPTRHAPPCPPPHTARPSTCLPQHATPSMSSSPRASSSPGSLSQELPNYKDSPPLTANILLPSTHIVPHPLTFPNKYTEQHPNYAPPQGTNASLRHPQRPDTSIISILFPITITT